jgi:hypothetical protein
MMLKNISFSYLFLVIFVVDLSVIQTKFKLNDYDIDENDEQLEKIIEKIADKISNDLPNDDLKISNSKVLPKKSESSSLSNVSFTTKSSFTKQPMVTTLLKSKKVSEPISNTHHEQHTNSWTMFFILCILGYFFKLFY